MLLTITISVFTLVAINFLLLLFSVNKTTKQVKIDKKPVVLNPQITKEQASESLAPTGS